MKTLYIEDQLSELAQLVMIIGNDQSAQPTPIPCDFCTQNGHHTDMCPYLQGKWEEVQEMGSYYWPNQWSYDQWWNNNQVWGDNQYQACGYDQYQPMPQFQRPYPPPPQQLKL